MGNEHEQAHERGASFENALKTDDIEFDSYVSEIYTIFGEPFFFH
jgi:hypothetical protein